MDAATSSPASIWPPGPHLVDISPFDGTVWVVTWLLDGVEQTTDVEVHIDQQGWTEMYELGEGPRLPNGIRKRLQLKAMERAEAKRRAGGDW